MKITDWIGFAGVFLLLIAFFLNLTKIISEEDLSYTLLNFFGAAIAGVASAMLHFIPFVILEAAWCLISLVAIINHIRTHWSKT